MNDAIVMIRKDNGILRRAFQTILRRRMAGQIDADIIVPARQCGERNALPDTGGGDMDMAGDHLADVGMAAQHIDQRRPIAQDDAVHGHGQGQDMVMQHHDHGAVHRLVQTRGQPVQARGADDPFDKPRFAAIQQDHPVALDVDHLLHMAIRIGMIRAHHLKKGGTVVVIAQHQMRVHTERRDDVAQPGIGRRLSQIGQIARQDAQIRIGMIAVHAVHGSAQPCGGIQGV